MSTSGAVLDHLFEPVTIGSLVLPNRIAMAPMTRSFSPGGILPDGAAEYYARRARANVGLIITEGIFLDHPTSGFSPLVPVMHGNRAGAAWSEVVGAVHGAGAKIAAQLWHVGAQPVPDDIAKPGVSPLSASGLIGPATRVGEPMTGAQIAEVTDSYAGTAKTAQRLGFDGIELHAGHGYLIDSYFWHGTNERQDCYGGDIAARTRFAADIVSECRRRTGPNFPIILRFSQWKNVDYGAKLASSPNELERFLAPLVDAGVDVFHCSTRRFWEPEFSGSSLNLAGWAKQLSGKPTITVGSVGLTQELFESLSVDQVLAQGDNLSQLTDMLERGEFDVVAIGRALLADPEWVSKVREGRRDELNGFSRMLLGTLQ
jgi:2,4-dienoyl-CoA reductase-like NADH-dependent reductase (Old Yellow Enzyme family)